VALVDGIFNRDNERPPLVSLDGAPADRYEAVYLERRARDSRRDEPRELECEHGAQGEPATVEPAATLPVGTLETPAPTKEAATATRVSTPERRYSLQDMAARLTGKRSRG
jgi:hypothetical protein